VARIAHLRSIHITPPDPAEQICGGELVPCEALFGRRFTASSPNYDACREAEQPPKRSSRFFEAMELAMLRKVDQAQCAIVVNVSRTVMGR